MAGRTCAWRPARASRNRKTNPTNGPPSGGGIWWISAPPIPCNPDLRYREMKLSVCLSAVLLALPAAGQVKITRAAEKIAVEINGKPFGDFYVAGPDVTKPYLWPLRAATGTYVTRMWPMEKVAEEAANKKPDHQHQ